MNPKPDLIEQLLQVSEECILAAPLHTCGCREKVKKLLRVVRREALSEAAMRLDDPYSARLLKRMAKES